MTTSRSFQKGQIVEASSGKLYAIVGICEHPTLKGETEYQVIGWRNGRWFGPFRTLRDGAIRQAAEAAT